MNKKMKRIQITIDDETLKILLDESYKKFGRTNVSLLIRQIVRERFGDKDDRDKK